jgi:choline dehydrogenase-like flavoprotein
VDGTTVAACLRPGEGLQRRAGILNTSFALGSRQHPDARMSLFKRLYQAARHELAPTRGNRRLWQAYKHSRTWLRERLDPLLPWLMDRLDQRGIYAVVRAEQAPNFDSRVRLGPDRDALGVPRAVLDWQLSELDKHSVRVAMEGFDAELRRLRLGYVEIPDWLRDEGRPWQIDPLVSGHPIGGFHHMGTTRMATGAAQGVVDPDGRVFGLANLYVAGSSVFPTSGWANPTLTLAALTLRLAAHLEGKLSLSAWGRQVA